MSPLRYSISSHTPIHSKAISSHIDITSSTCSSHSSYKGSAATTSTNQTKKEQTHTTQKTALSKEQTNALISGNISLSEFIHMYNSVPTRNRNKIFRTNCRAYVYKLSKTKNSFEEKKAMFLSLPQKLAISQPLFKLIFEKESTMLKDIMYGKTDPKQLQTSINQLLQFFPTKYLKKQICQYVTCRKHLSREDKSIIASCREQLRSISEKHTTSETPPEQTPITYKSNSSDEEQNLQKNEQKFDPEAKTILDSLESGTIDTNNIISSRKKLILLKVGRDIINSAFNRFRYHIQTSDRQDIAEVLQIINESGKQTAKIRSVYTKNSEQLQLLLNKAHSGVLQIEDIPNLRDLLFKEYSLDRAYSCMKRVKKILVKHNTDKEDLIIKAFKKTTLQQPTKSNCYQDLKTKIKSGSLDVHTFTSIYNDIPPSDKTGTLSRLCSTYIKNLSDTTEDKLTLLKSLPISLQKSSSTLSALFPKESYIMSLFKTGSIPSRDIKTHCTQLLKITDPQHVLNLLYDYSRKNKDASTEDKDHIFECKNFVKQQWYIQSQLTTNQSEPHKTRKRSSLESLYKEQPTSVKRSKPDINSQIQLILKSLNDCSIKTKNIVGAMEQLISLNVDTYTIKKSFKDFENKIILSHRPNKKEILKEIDRSVSKIQDQDSYEASTNTSQSIRSQIPTTVKHAQYQETHASSTTYTPTQHETYKRLDKQTDLTEQQVSPTITATYITEQPITNTQTPIFINPTSPQPSTSQHSIDTITKTAQPSYIEQMSADELTCILQSIVNEDENSENQIILHNYLMQLANELQQESDIADQTTSNQEEPSHTDTIDPQDTHTPKSIHDYEPSQVPEDFMYITDITNSLNHEDFEQLTDTLVGAMPFQELASEDFFDFSNIDER